MATYAIGDIQGCFDSLHALVSKLPLQAEDELWLCGDLVNRGPKNAEVLRWAIEQGDRVKAVLGNHDLHLLCRAEEGKGPRTKDSFGDVLDAPDREQLLAYLRSLPFVHLDGDNLMVHAGVLPSWTLNTVMLLGEECREALQSPLWLDAWHASRATPPEWSAELEGEDRLACALSVFVGVRTLRGHSLVTDYAGPPEGAPKMARPWFEGVRLDKTVVHGHWAALGLQRHGAIVSTDTGCVWGGKLTAVRLEDRAIFQEPSIEF